MQATWEGAETNSIIKTSIHSHHYHADIVTMNVSFVVHICTFLQNTLISTDVSFMTHHELYVEALIVCEVSHEGLEALSLSAHIFEVVKGCENYGMSTLHQTDGRQQLQHQCFRSAHLQ